jgi:hypothetical protein
LSKSCSRPTQSSWADWLNKGINPKVKLDEIKAEERRQTEQAEARTAANEATAKGELVTFRQACELYTTKTFGRSSLPCAKRTAFLPGRSKCSS